MGNYDLLSSSGNEMVKWLFEGFWMYRGEDHDLESIGFDPRARGELVGGRFVCGGILLL